MKFDSYTVAELKALCSELGIAFGNSAPKTEYVTGLEKYFQAENVDEALMALGRDNLQKVARRFSLTASGTKRELTDAILAKVNPPQPGPVVTAPVVADPESGTAETRKGLPWWVWALIVAGIVLIAVLIFRPRPQIASVDLSPLQASIGQVSTKVDALGQSITDLTGRVDALEQASAIAPPKAEAPAEVVEEPVVEVSATSALPESLQANACKGIGGNAFKVEEVIKPLDNPWEWAWIDPQKWVTDHKQLPFKDCAILAQRPNTYLVVDADYSGTVNGYAEHAVTIYYLPDGQPQRDIFVFYGQYHVLDGAAPLEDVITLAKAIASHTGSSNRTEINFVIAERPAQ